MEQSNNFEYVFLGDVDPTFKPIDAGPYNLRVIKAFIKPFKYSKGARAGETGEQIKLQLAVTDHPQYSGRRVFATLFPNDFSLRALRRLQDNTGVVQEGNEPIADWLARLASEGAVFNVQVNVTERTGADGAPVSDNDVDWKTIQPSKA